jgi:hypothetical protein
MNSTMGFQYTFRLFEREERVKVIYLMGAGKLICPGYCLIPLPRTIPSTEKALHIDIFFQ